MRPLRALIRKNNVKNAGSLESFLEELYIVWPMYVEDVKYLNMKGCTMLMNYWGDKMFIMNEQELIQNVKGQLDVDMISLYKSSHKINRAEVVKKLNKFNDSEEFFLKPFNFEQIHDKRFLK